MPSPGPLKILLIGASGFVSGTLAQAALDRRHKVWAVTRGQRPLAKDITPLVADRSDAGSFEQAIHNANSTWDVVVDCIGYEPADARQDLAVFKTRTRHLIFISTDFVYDPARRKFPMDETWQEFHRDGYGGKKRLCELEIMNGTPEVAGDLRWTILRPCHIYGPGSQLGCLPLHGRDPDLLKKIRAGEALRLVGGGTFLQQPIFAPDLAQTILSCAGNEQAFNQIFLTAGPEIVESREYYRIIAEILGLELEVEEVPLSAYWNEHPEARSFLCHRVYDLKKLRAHGLHVPATPLREGLRRQVSALSAQPFH